MTRPPRMLAGVFSAAKTGDVVALGPIPMPSNRRQTWIYDRLSRAHIEKKRDYKKLRPGLHKSFTDNAQCTENTTPEQRPTSTKEVVERIREPASKKTCSNIRPVLIKLSYSAYISSDASADHAGAYPELIIPTIH